eukprot:COSAG05_NODE_244_length_12990_cov_6.892018_3_plen_95_part_00
MAEQPPEKRQRVETAEPTVAPGAGAAVPTAPAASATSDGSSDAVHAETAPDAAKVKAACHSPHPPLPLARPDLRLRASRTLRFASFDSLWLRAP